MLHKSDTYEIALLNVVSNLFVCLLINHVRVNYSIVLPFVSRQFDRRNHCITFVLSAERNNDVDIYTEQTRGSIIVSDYCCGTEMKAGGASAGVS